MKNINKKMSLISGLIDAGEFQRALDCTYDLLEAVNSSDVEKHILNQIIFNLAGFLVDIGHMHGDKDAALKGLCLFEENKSVFIDLVGESEYYYNLANAKTNMVEEKNPFNHTFHSIEQLVDQKSYLWKAIKTSKRKDGSDISTYLVNLGNSLKQQFRISEALKCYDDVNLRNENIPQSWINRSETLAMLNTVTSSYSIQMINQIRFGYEKASTSANIPPQWRSSYLHREKINSDLIKEICERESISIDIHDAEITREEYEGLTEFRRFCLDKNLSLSEHGLYCKCSGSARDNLTIPTSAGVIGNFVIPMEMVLNRVKSEFSFARRLFFEYKFHDEQFELGHESCFSELFNDELLGIDVEKLRTAFRLCFGILDKIAVAICELYDLYPPNKNVSFQSFWQLSHGDRRERFEKVKNPGLLALYSIATDLNERKDGEWAFLKDWRNTLEHEFLVIHTSAIPNDIYKSYDFFEGIQFIHEKDFVSYLEQTFQITRSAIFSFVFSVRHAAMSEEKKPGRVYIHNEILRKNFE